MQEYKSPNMYALKAKETQIKDSASDDNSTLNEPHEFYCLYQIIRDERGILTVEDLTEGVPNPRFLGTMIGENWQRIVQESGTENIKYAVTDDFPDSRISIRDHGTFSTEYTSLSKGEKDKVIAKMNQALAGR